MRVVVKGHDIDILTHETAEGFVIDRAGHEPAAEEQVTAIVAAETLGDLAEVFVEKDGDIVLHIGLGRGCLDRDDHFAQFIEGFDL